VPLNVETTHSLQFALYRPNQAVAEFYYLTTSSAYQMVMMTRWARAPFVPIQTIIELDLVEDSHTCEQLQAPIHGHQADAWLPASDRVVGLLGREMPSTVRAEKLEHRPALRRQFEPAVTKLL